jgi:hypothetical protein
VWLVERLFSVSFRMRDCLRTSYAISNNMRYILTWMTDRPFDITAGQLRFLKMAYLPMHIFRHLFPVSGTLKKGTVSSETSITFIISIHCDT